MSQRSSQPHAIVTRDPAIGCSCIGAALVRLEDGCVLLGMATLDHESTRLALLIDDRRRSAMAALHALNERLENHG